MKSTSVISVFMIAATLNLGVGAQDTIPEEVTNTDVNTETVYADEFSCYLEHGFPHEVLDTTNDLSGNILYEATTEEAKKYPCLVPSVS